MGRLTKEAAQKLRDGWLEPLNTYFQKFAGASHLSFFKSTALFRCINAANQAGKTTAMQAEVVAKLLGKHPWQPNFPNRRILVIITRTDQAATVWGKRLLKACDLPGEVGKKPWIDRHYIKTNANGKPSINWRIAQKYGRYPGSFELTTGSEYFMALAGDPDSWQGLEGIKFDDIYQDEATGTESLMDELDPRLWYSRENNPGGGGKVWGATETKDNIAYQTFKEKCQKGVDNHAFYYFPYQENTSISEATRQTARTTMSPEAFQVRALGLGSTADRVKVIAPYWKAEVHERKDPYRIRPDDNLWISFDPGWKDKCGILCGVVSRETPRLVRLLRWYSYKFGGYNHAIMDMKTWLDGRTCTRMVCDAQIHGSMQHNGRTYYTEFCELLDTHKIKMAADPLTEKPRIEDSLANLQDALQNHGDGYDPYRNSIECDMTGQGMEVFIGELLNSRWQIDREGNVLKTMVQRHLEAFDTLRYLIHFRPQWMDYGEEQGMTEPTAVPAQVTDPDLALHLARMAAGTRILEEEGLFTTGDSISISFSV